MKKHIIASFVAAAALSVSGALLAEDETSVLVSGDEPMEVGDAAEAPTPNAEEQAKTAEMLKEEAGEIGGDTNPIDEGDAAQMTEPKE
jgi:hypothetical protein